MLSVFVKMLIWFWCILAVTEQQKPKRFGHEKVPKPIFLKFMSQTHENLRKKSELHKFEKNTIM